MNNAVFIEGKEFFAWCAAEKRLDRPGWTPTVWFERKSDYGKERVQSMKHSLKTSFVGEHPAVQAALTFAEQCMAKGETGL